MASPAIIKEPSTPTAGEEVSATEKKALELFRLFHGTGDSGAELEFFAQSKSQQAGWRRLARKFRNIESDLAYMENLYSENHG
jgi:hypothetical protein